MDGRYIHWVKPFSGVRYSLIFYTTEEAAFTPKGACVYPPVEFSSPK